MAVKSAGAAFANVDMVRSEYAGFFRAEAAALLDAIGPSSRDEALVVDWPVVIFTVWLARPNQG